jgi:hypothetical protein
MLTDNAPSPISLCQGTLVSHAGFLERRAWRAKIAADASRFADGPIDLQAHLSSEIVRRYRSRKDSGRVPL